MKIYFNKQEPRIIYYRMTKMFSIYFGQEFYSSESFNVFEFFYFNYFLFIFRELIHEEKIEIKNFKFLKYF